MGKASSAIIESLIFLLLALGCLIAGLVPLLAVERCLGLINHLFTLLFVVYLSLFFSLSLLPLAGRLIARASGLGRAPAGLRIALLIEAAGLSAVWYKLLNPFPVQPLLANQQYIPAALILLVLLLAWLLFLFILRKIL